MAGEKADSITRNRAGHHRDRKDDSWETVRQVARGQPTAARDDIPKELRGRRGPFDFAQDSGH